VTATAVVSLGIWVTPIAVHAAQDVLYGPDASEPSCSWAQVRLTGADADQAALVRCYLRAVAERSQDGLLAVVPSRDNGGPSGFAAADFAHAATVAGGVTTVAVVGNTTDSADAAVNIRYADGSRQELEIHLANPTSSHSWRFQNLGTFPEDGPPPAQGLSVVGAMLGVHGDRTVLAAH
jgi:hypothetical protein